MTDLADLDGVTVHAMALGYDGTETDASDWSLYRDDMPKLTSLIGVLTVNRVDDLAYTQYVVNGIPVDPATVSVVDYSGSTVVASGWEGVARDADGKWTTSGSSANGKVSKEVDQAMTKYLQGSPTVPYDKLVKVLKKHGFQHPHDYISAVLQANTLATGEIKKPPLSAAQKAAATKVKQKENVDHLAAQVAAKKESDDAAAAEASNAAWHAEQMNQVGVTPATPVAAQTNAQLWAAHTEPPKPPEHHADSALSLATAAGEPPTMATLDNASLGSIDAYLKKNMSPKALAAAHGDVRKIAKNVASQHVLDQMALGQLGYPEMPNGAIEARRAVLRETGERKPTGGPGDPTIHQFYEDSTIASMSTDKLKALIAHHSAGTKDVTGLDTEQLKQWAGYYNDSYKSNVNALLELGVPASKIPHGAFTTSVMSAGNSNGFIEGLPIMHVPLPTPSSSAPWTPGPTPMPNPSPAPTYGYGKNKTDVPKPAEYQNWSPGKKAAWTKKHKVGGANVGYGGAKAPKAPSAPAKPVVGTAVTFEATHPLGEHSTSVHNSQSEALGMYLAFNSENPSQEGNPHHQSRVNALRAKLTSAERAAWTNYTGNGYKRINRCAKYGENCTPSINATIRRLTESYRLGTTTPKELVRGKNNGPMADLDYKVGQVFNEPGMGSWSTQMVTAKGFAGVSYGGSGVKRSVLTHLVDTKGALSVPGVHGGEGESVMPPGSQYRVLRIHDATAPGGVQLRTMWVELVGTTAVTEVSPAQS